MLIRLTILLLALLFVAQPVLPGSARTLRPDTGAALMAEPVRDDTGLATGLTVRIGLAVILLAGIVIEVRRGRGAQWH